MSDEDEISNLKERELVTRLFALDIPVTPGEETIRRQARSGQGDVAHPYFSMACPDGHGRVRSAPITRDGSRGPRRLSLHYVEGRECRYSRAIVPGKGPGAEAAFHDFVNATRRLSPAPAVNS